MKKYFYFFLFLTGLAGFTACEDKSDDVVVPSEAQKQLAVITAKLKTVSGISATFIDDLSKIDLRNSKETAFTVFAVKADSTKLLPPKSGEITRQLIRGRYSKANLTDGLTLMTVKGDNLSVKVIAGKVFVDGLEITSDTTAVDKSAIFVVSGYFPAKAPKLVAFKVQSCNVGWKPGDSIPQYVAAKGAEIAFYANDSLLTEKYITGDNGMVSFLIDTLNYKYLVSKGDEKNITADGYQIAGIFTSQSELDSIKQDGAKIGGLRFADLNGDKVINDTDKTTKAKFIIADTVTAFIAKH